MAGDWTLIFYSVNATESIRHAFFIGGVEFEEVKIAENDFRKKYPSGFHAVLQCGDKKKLDGLTEVANLHSILRIVGKFGKLYPDDPFIGMRIDEVLELCKTFRTKLAARGITLEDVLENLNSVIDHKYAVSEDKMTVADLELLAFVNWLIYRDESVIEMIAQYANLARVCEFVRNHPAIVEAEKQRIKNYMSNKAKNHGLNV